MEHNSHPLVQEGLIVLPNEIPPKAPPRARAKRTKKQIKRQSEAKKKKSTVNVDQMGVCIFTYRNCLLHIVHSL